MVAQRVNSFLELLSEKNYPVIVYIENQVNGKLEEFYDGTTLGLILDVDLFLIDIHLLGQKFVLICAW